MDFGSFIQLLLMPKLMSLHRFLYSDDLDAFIYSFSVRYNCLDSLRVSLEACYNLIQLVRVTPYLCGRVAFEIAVLGFYSH